MRKPRAPSRTKGRPPSPCRPPPCPTCFEAHGRTHAVGAEQFFPARRVVACNHEARGLAKGGREDGKAARGSGSSVWRGRRGQTQPQREWPPRPPEPPNPDVPITARSARAHSASIIASEGRAITRHSLTRRMSAVASSRPHPMASRRRSFAVGQPSVDGVCPRRRGRCVRFAFIGRSSSAYLGSLSRATTSLFF